MQSVAADDAQTQCALSGDSPLVPPKPYCSQQDSCKHACAQAHCRLCASSSSSVCNCACQCYAFKSAGSLPWHVHRTTAQSCDLSECLLLTNGHLHAAGEKFETFWDDELQQWRYKDARRLDAAEASRCSSPSH